MASSKTVKETALATQGTGVAIVHSFSESLHTHTHTPHRHMCIQRYPYMYTLIIIFCLHFYVCFIGMFKCV